MATESNHLQIFVQSPELRIPSRALMVNPNHTLHHLKCKFLPKTIPSQTLDSLYFSFHGKPLQDTSTIFDHQILPLSNLTLRIRVSGGGGDGGATGAESRDCYLNMYAVKKPDKVDPNETRLSRWTTCSLSFEPLKPPCVIDRIGNLFNKEPLVEALLGKKLPKEFGHIRGLKDMIPIHLSPIPTKNSDDEICFDTKFQCPIAGVELNGKFKFFALKTCGHVLSAKALKEVKSSTCLVCHQGFSELDKIVINGSVEEVAELKEKMEMEKAKLREKKEKKKVKNNGVENTVCLESFGRLSGMKHGINEKDAENCLVKSEVNGKIGNAGSVAKETNNNGLVMKKRFKATDIAPPNATKEVYASIFTSSRKSEFKETYSCRETEGRHDYWVFCPLYTVQYGRSYLGTWLTHLRKALNMKMNTWFISVPKDMGPFNSGAFVAGIVRGVLDSAGFPAVVTAHFVPMEGQQRPRTTILIKFAEEVLRREARLG